MPSGLSEEHIRRLGDAFRAPLDDKTQILFELVTSERIDAAEAVRVLVEDWKDGLL